jgi:hypothetical protein
MAEVGASHGASVVVAARCSLRLVARIAEVWWHSGGPLGQFIMLKKVAKHLGSTVALILGFVSFAGALGPATGNHAGLISGPVMILGALAYRSAKKRMLGDVRSTALRQVIEVGAIVLAVLVVVLQNDLKVRIATDPFPNFVIPLWAVVAYFIMTIRAELQQRRIAETA